MNKNIIKDRNTEIDKTLQKAFARRSNKINDNEEFKKKDILADKFLKSNGMNTKMIKAQFNIKEAVLHLEKNSQLTIFYPIETHRESLLGKGIVWFKRTVLKAMLRFDVSLKYQNQYNLTLIEIIRRLVDKTDLLGNKLKEQQSTIDDLKKILKEKGLVNNSSKPGGFKKF